MQASILQTPTYQKEFEIGLTLVREQKFMEALDRFKLCLDASKHHLPLIQIELYKKLHLDIENLKLRIVIVELFIYNQRYSEAILEIEDMVSIDVNYTQSYFILGKIYSKVGAEDRATIKAVFEHAFHAGVTDISVLDLLASIYFEEQEYEKSVQLFERLIEIKPQSLHYLKTLSELYKRLNRHEQSAGCYEKLCKLSPDYTQETIPKIIELVTSKESLISRIVLVKLYARTCDIDKTIFEIKKVVNIHPKAGKPLTDLVSHTLDIFPDQIDLMLLKAKALLLEQEYIEGLTFLKTFIDQVSSKKEVVHLLEFLMSQPIKDTSILGFAYGLIFDIYYSHKNYKKCFSCLEQAMKHQLTHFENTTLDKKIEQLMASYPTKKAELDYFLFQYFDYTHDHAALSKMAPKFNDGPYAYDVLLAHANSLIQQKKQPEAHQLLLNQIHKFPYDKSIHKHLKKNHLALASKTDSPTASPYEKGLSYMTDGQFLSAIDEFQKLQLGSPSYYKAQSLIVMALFDMARFNLAIDHIDRTLQQLNPAEPENLGFLHVVKAVCHLHSGKPDQAFLAIQKLEETNSQQHLTDLSSRLTSYSKRCLEQSGKPKTLSGCSHFSQQLYCYVAPNNAQPETSISFAQSQNNQGVDYFLQKNTKAAEQSFNLAHKMDPSIASVCSNLALVSLVQHKIEATFEWLTKAEKIDPNLDAIYLNRGLCFLAQNETSAAEHQFQRAIALHPSNYTALIHLGDIYLANKKLKHALGFYKRAAETGHLFNLINHRLPYLFENYCSKSTWTSVQHMPLLTTIFKQVES